MGKDLRDWNPDDEAQWNATGKAIATRNLWISIPSLLCGFAVWLYWGIITVQMVNLDFGFAASELFTLGAIAGLTGGDASYSINILHPDRGRQKHNRLYNRLADDPGIGRWLGIARPRHTTLVLSKCWHSCLVLVAATSPHQCQTSLSSIRRKSKAMLWA